MTIKIALTAGTCLLGLGAAPASAATQIVAAGKLTGATGVLIGGTSYDVAFLDGTCESVYGACAQSNFTFKTTNAAGLAAQALLDQVFLDTNLGLFDSNPALTNGCTDSVVCRASIPFAVSNSPEGLAFAVAAQNNSGNSFDYTNPTSFFADNLTTLPRDTFARFSLSPMTGAVPEPTTWLTMLLGFGMMGATIRYRRRSTKTAYA